MAISPLKDWAKALDAYVAGDREEVVPDGWMTKRDIADHWGKSDVYVNRIIQRMMRSGLVEQKSFIVRLKKCDRGNGAGYCRSLPHYKLKKGKS
jgi:hypothetical protein